MTTTVFQRSFPLDDLQIRPDGEGRTVVAYAAVFDVETEIRDQQGHYRERIARNAFAKTVKDRGTRFGVFYNHGLTLHGTPSERGSMPLGSPVEPPRSDGKGLVTVTRYNRTAQADEVLEAIRNGDITGQSFTGRTVKSDPAMPRGGYRAARDGTLPLVTRTEIALSEYGPTPIPAYEEPMLIGVRSRTVDDPAVWQALLAELGDLDDEDRAELVRALGLATPLDAATAAGEGEPAEPSATPAPTAGAGADEPRAAHSGRPLTPQATARAAMILRGM